MRRDHKKPLRFPVLVDANHKNLDGYLGLRGTSWRAVRVIDPEEARQKLKGKGLFDGLDLMRYALAEWDENALTDATEMVRPYLTVPGISVEEPDDKKWDRGRWDYCSLMSEALENARLVMWRGEGERLIPAVYCPDLKTAAFVTLYLGGVRICPRCKQPFVPEKDNQAYCTPQHGAAHRTARSRWRAELRVSEKAGKIVAVKRLTL